MVLVLSTVFITLAATIGGSLPSAEGVSMFWPAAGVAAAFSSAGGRKSRPWVVSGVVLGTIASALFASSPTWSHVFGAALANGAEAYIAGALLGPAIPQGRRIVRMSDVMALLRTSVLAAAVGGVIGGLATWLALDAGLVESMARWFVADAVGIFLITPGLLGAISAVRDGAKHGQWFRLVLYGAATMLVLLGAIQLRELTDRNFAYLILLPLMLSTIYVGQRGTAILMIITSFAAAYTTGSGNGPFAASDSPIHPLIAMQVFLVVIQFSLMLVSTEATRRRDVLAEIEGVFDAALDAVLMVDEDGVVRRANQASEEILGGRVLGRNSAEFLTEPLDATVVMDQRAVLTRGRRLDGTEFWAEFSAGKVIEESLRHRRALIIRDVTQRIEAQEKLEQMRDQFVSNMTHELRTPLTSIVGYTDWLLEGAEGEQRSDLEVIRTSAATLSELVDDILDFKRVSESGATAELIDLTTLVEKVATALEPAAEGRSVELVRHAENKVEVVGDYHQLERVVANLVSNAIKYSKQGTDVVIELRSLDRAARLRISDQGIGISAEDQARIFERFFRARSAVTAGIPGTGLGLAMARDVARAHKGDLTLESSLGVGTTMTLDLPLAETAADLPRVR